MTRSRILAVSLVVACGGNSGASVDADATTGSAGDEETDDSLGPPLSSGMPMDDVGSPVQCVDAGGTVCDETVASSDELQELAGCEVVRGSVTLTHTLVPLPSLRVIERGLSLDWDGGLQTFDGLDCLEEVGSFAVLSGPWLRDLTALRNMRLRDAATSTDAGLNIQGTSVLESLDGLQGVTEAYAVSISENAKLLDLEGLSGLQRIGLYITISENPLLTDLGGLRNLSVIDGRLHVAELESLESLDGLEKIRSLGALTITDNPVLTSLDGLAGLESVTGDVTFSNNAMLPREEIDELLAHVVVGGQVIIE